MTLLALLQNNSFLPKIKENLTLIPYKEASTEQRSKQRYFIYNPTKKNHKLGDLYTSWKTFLYKS